MYEHSLDPVAVSVGPVSVYWYGLVYAAGFLFLYYYLPRFSFFDDEADDYIVWAVLGVILGSRAFTFLFWYPESLLSNPLRFFAVWQGGMSFHGGFVGLAAATYWYAQRNNTSFYDIADAVSIPAGVFLGIGRVANFVNAELIGTPYTGRFCVDYPAEKLGEGVADVCRHPYQLYAAAKNALITPVLYAWSTTRSLPAGAVFWGFTLLYNASRFFVDFTRADPSVALGLSTGQLLSALFAGIASYMLVAVYKRDE